MIINVLKIFLGLKINHSSAPVIYQKKNKNKILSDLMHYSNPFQVTSHAISFIVFLACQVILFCFIWIKRYFVQSRHGDEFKV